ncbi:MAG: CpsB/CapC family capsule biosynthesis tyrosine phosphatase, partial [Bacteroidota bacterium]
KLLQNLVEQGCLAQISTGSIWGRFGTEAKKAADAFLARGLAHLLGTDAHGADRRRMIMAEARDMVAAHYGTEAARALTVDNPSSVIEGRECKPAEQSSPRSGLKAIVGSLFR